LIKSTSFADASTLLNVSLRTNVTPSLKPRMEKTRLSEKENVTPAKKEPINIPESVKEQEKLVAEDILYCLLVSFF
jgi:hypothetical protein